MDGVLTYITDGFRAHDLLPIEDVPLTLAGISRHNVQNAMAVASAALGIGLSREVVARGLGPSSWIRRPTPDGRTCSSSAGES